MVVTKNAQSASAVYWACNMMALWAGLFETVQYEVDIQRNNALKLDRLNIPLFIILQHHSISLLLLQPCLGICEFCLQRRCMVSFRGQRQHDTYTPGGLVCGWQCTSSHQLQLYWYIAICGSISPQFENTFFTFFFENLKNATFYVFFEVSCQKKRRKRCPSFHVSPL